MHYSIVPFIIIPLTIINKGVIVNDTHFIIKINPINYFFNNRVKLKYDTYYEKEEIVVSFRLIDLQNDLRILKGYVVNFIAISRKRRALETKCCILLLFFILVCK